MGQEIELKYQVPPERLAALEEALAPKGGWERVAMETTYYDTADGALAARQWVLRARRENRLRLVTLKTKGNGFARGEWEFPGAHPAEVLAQLVKEGAPAALPALCGGGLIPICGAKFTRLRGLVSLPGCTVELALDSGCLTGGGHQEALCELEVEFKSGDPRQAMAYAAHLADKWALAPEARGKFTRALALTKG